MSRSGKTYFVTGGASGLFSNCVCFYSMTQISKQNIMPAARFACALVFLHVSYWLIVCFCNCTKIKVLAWRLSSSCIPRFLHEVGAKRYLTFFFCSFPLRYQGANVAIVDRDVGEGEKVSQRLGDRAIFCEVCCSSKNASTFASIYIMQIN